MVPPTNHLSLQEADQLKQRIAEIEGKLRTARGALRELETVYSTVPVGLCQVDTELRFVRINQRLADVNGVSVEQHIGRPMFEVVPRIQDQLQPILETVLRSGEAILNVEIVGVSPAAPDRDSYFLGSYYPLHDFSGGVAGVNIVVQDVTEHKLAEQAARESEARYELIARVTSDFVWDVDLENETVWRDINSALVFGSRPQMTSGAWSWCTDQIHPEDRLHVLDSLKRAIEGTEGEWTDEYRLQKADGSYAEIVDRGHIVRDASGHAIRILGAMLDVSQLKKTERDLQRAHNELEDRVQERTAKLTESEERWRSLIATAPDLIVVINPDGSIRYINYAEEGFLFDEVLGISAYDFVRPDFRDRMRECVESVLRTGELDEMELAVNLPDGDVAWYAARVGPLWHDGKISAVTSISTNITERKRVEAALAESEERFRTIFEQAEVGIAQVDPAGQFLRVNRKFSDILGFTPEELVTRSFQDITHPDDLADNLNQVQRVIDGDMAAYATEKRYFRQDGSIMWANLSIVLVRDESSDPKYFISIVEDISQRKVAEELLISKQELLRQLLDFQETERQMVAQDIHDGFVQDVVGAHFFLQSIHEESKPDSILPNVERAASLLAKAIAEGRRMIRDLRPMVLDERGVLEAIKHLAADEETIAGLVVRFEHHVDFDRLDLKLEGTIFRIVQEALSNVRHHSQSLQAIVEMTQTNGMLELVVRDQGIGFDTNNIPLEHFGIRGIHERARIFGGVAKIDSTPGQGTTVTVQLPLENMTAERTS